MANVRCYAGASYPERPVALEWEGQWLEVVEVLRQARTPQGFMFWVVTGDGQRFRLEWDARSDKWDIMIELGG